MTMKNNTRSTTAQNAATGGRKPGGRNRGVMKATGRMNQSVSRQNQRKM